MTKHGDLPDIREHTHLHTYTLNTQTVWALKPYRLHPRPYTILYSSFQHTVSPVPGPGAARESRHIDSCPTELAIYWRRPTKWSANHQSFRYCDEKRHQAEQPRAVRRKRKHPNLLRGEETGLWEGRESGVNTAVLRNSRLSAVCPFHSKASFYWKENDLF